jgi:hypothetical protein
MLSPSTTLRTGLSKHGVGFFNALLRPAARTPEASGGRAGVLSAGPLSSFDGAQDRDGSLRLAKSERLLECRTHLVFREAYLV